MLSRGIGQPGVSDKTLAYAPQEASEMTRVRTTRDVAPYIGTLMLAWFLAMAVLVCGGEGRGDGFTSRAPDPCKAAEVWQRTADRDGDGLADSDRDRERLEGIPLPPGAPAPPAIARYRVRSE